MNNSTNENIKLWVYFLFFLAGLMSLPLGLIFIGIFSGTLASLQNAFASSGLNIFVGFYIYLSSIKLNNFIYIITVLPLFICSIFFAAGMYVFKNRSYIFALKAFVSSFVASIFMLPILILIIFLIVFSFLPYVLFLIIVVHFAAHWFIYEKYPSMMFPLKAFISSFYILFLIMLIMWGYVYFLAVGSRTFGH